MIKKLKRIVLTVATAIALSAPGLVTVTAHAADLDTKGSATCGVEVDVNSTGCTPGGSGATGLNDLIKKIINIFSIIIGVIAVIMIIVGGLKYITSGGESSNVSGAKNTIIYAIVGLIVVALAQFIVRFVLRSTEGIS
ncbi:MAG TPA: hypothetical protein VF572_05885 [Candidatus Saccharimonadales bacterium]|jgi:hypothetical protein